VSIDFQAYTADALQAWHQGNLPLTDVLCDIMVRMGCADPVVVGLQGLVALNVGEYKRAVDLLTTATKGMADPQLREGLNAARKGLREQAMVRADGRKRYLVIKAWGYGFCSDLDHVLGCLLLAELTGRVPVIEWGRSSLFRDESDEDAWVRFFEPVSAVRASELMGKKLTYFPPKWNDGNLLEAEVNKFGGAWARMGACLYLNRREDVAVSDVHMSVTQVLSWARAGTAWAAMSPPAAYRAIVKKYLRPSAEVARRVEAFAQEHFTATPMIGVHARGGDKPVEDPILSERNKTTPELVDALLAKHPGAKVFLLTDDVKLREQYAARYGAKLVTTECLRTSTAHGLHYLQHESRTRLGLEVMVDMYLAARCDYFIGVGTSNVSAMIEHLKDWPEGTLDLRPFSAHYNLNPFLYRYSLSAEQEAELRATNEAQKARERQGG